MKNIFFAYIRVSTPKQGQGVSLQEQRGAILRYAEGHGLTIGQWFEEKETAAKRGRPLFNEMISGIRKGKVRGVIIHKIDRSARNLKDWADLGELIDQGIEVHFVNESLNLQTRGGRLAADVQAVVAADFIRNNREETRKGFYGRLKQGLYPLPAPLGYLDSGKGKPKALDPERAGHVRAAFELYATGRYGLHSLADELYRRGLRNRNGGRVTINGFSKMFSNPFYIGIIRLTRTKETFPGIHEPLVAKAVFERVHLVLKGKAAAKIQKHDLAFRRLITCKTCGYSLIGEIQKGFVYYRCHTPACATSLRETVIDELVQKHLAPLTFSDRERAYFADVVASLSSIWENERSQKISAVRLALAQVRDRLQRLTDAYLDAAIARELFDERQTALLSERAGLQETLAALEKDQGSAPTKLGHFLELAGSLYLRYETGIPAEKRELLKLVTSNFEAHGKNLDFKLRLPFSLVAKRPNDANGAPSQGRPRTLKVFMKSLRDWVYSNPVEALRLTRPYVDNDITGIADDKDMRLAA